MNFNQVEFGQRVKALRCSITVLLDISAYFDVSTDFLLTGRSFETLHIQKQLSEAQMILSDIMKSLK